MPFKISHVKGGYQVINKLSGKIYSKHTTLAKAKAQIRLLEMIKHK